MAYYKRARAEDFSGVESGGYYMQLRCNDEGDYD